MMVLVGWSSLEGVELLGAELGCEEFVGLLDCSGTLDVGNWLDSTSCWLLTVDDWLDCAG